ncbi:hypothetical protein H5410_015219 [Solanum commersonii]|uniref:Uncharacterized protein n=1 Tax=Solanum commersonii TaxID=4109 RepID=A0A9J5ZTH3_SOLCO|nr:hypothetical protein H5410_015219 [Solanum commersonii]
MSTQSHRYNSQRVVIVFKNCVGADHSASFHRRVALFFNIVEFWIIGRHSTASRNCSVTHRLLIFIVDLILSFRSQHIGTKGEDKTFGDSPNGFAHSRSKRSFKACNGAKCKEVPFFSTPWVEGDFLTLLDFPFSFHHTPNLGFWPTLAYSINHKSRGLWVMEKERSSFHQKNAAELVGKTRNYLGDSLSAVHRGYKGANKG